MDVFVWPWYLVVATMHHDGWYADVANVWRRWASVITGCHCLSAREMRPFLLFHCPSVCPSLRLSNLYVCTCVCVCMCVNINAAYDSTHSSKHNVNYTTRMTFSLNFNTGGGVGCAHSLSLSDLSRLIYMCLFFSQSNAYTNGIIWFTFIHVLMEQDWFSKI